MKHLPPILILAALVVTVVLIVMAARLDASVPTMVPTEDVPVAVVTVEVTRVITPTDGPFGTLTPFAMQVVPHPTKEPTP